ncbi:hypothetical protein [Ekhidna sp.]|uniref:hypothetical protein n=1 Tax=Ekhidna sp. TaxID=2608089 RepID=UPI0032967E1A
MKLKASLIVGLIFLGFAANAQICKYIVNEKDPITDDIIRTVRTRLTGPTPFYFFSYIRNGSDFKFNVEVGDYGELDTVIPKGSELVMRAGNGAVLKMQSIERSVPEIINDFGTKISRYDITFQMTEQDMKDITESGIVFIRIMEMKNTFSDQVVPEAVVEISKANAECIFK